MKNIFETLTAKYPFISLIIYGGNEHIGIIQNSDTVVTSFYNFGLLKTKEEKTNFLLLGEQWWWESNRQIPINIYLRGEWEPFRYTLQTFVTKDVSVAHGPNTSLQHLTAKRSKRRSITLVRRMN